MTAWTLDHVDYVPDAAVTSVAEVVTPTDVQDVDEQHIRALTAGEPLHPDPAARARMAAALYAITGWETFGYAEVAASESAEEAAEHRQILRRRRPPWADED
jgi:hypothetical protein